MKCVLFMSEREMKELAKRLKVSPGALPRMLEDGIYRAGFELQFKSDTPPHRTYSLRPFENVHVECVDG